MLWRTRKRDALRPEPSSHALDPARDPLVYTSPGLEGLTQRLCKDCTYQILDLGSAQGANVDFFSGAVSDCQESTGDSPDEEPSDDASAQADSENTGSGGSGSGKPLCEERSERVILSRACTFGWL